MANKTKKSDRRRYSGNSLKKTVSVEYKEQTHTLMPYLPSEGLVEAVNLALLLKRPLLLMGEPGCGKTRLAQAVAYDLYLEDFRNHYEEWRIKSTTKAKDGLYRFDALKRLYDVQTSTIENGTSVEQINNTKLGEKDSYFQRGKLAEAFHKSKVGNPCVLLIDEIDKADIDFPNDLLGELDNYEFTVEETGEVITQPEEKPLIIITSNKERELPAAFLRRCIYYYIDFPNSERLEEIVRANYGKAVLNDTLLNKGLHTFHYIKSKSRNESKQISTSELLDWVLALVEYSKNEDYKNLIDDWTVDWENKAIEDDNLSDNIQDEIGKIPFAQVLIKDEYMWRKMKKMLSFDKKNV